MLDQHLGDPTAVDTTGYIDKRSTITFFYLTFTFAFITFQLWGNLWGLAFIIPWYIQMVMICFLTQNRDRQKGVVWIYCILTTTIFGWVILYPMPSYLKSIIWVISSTIIVVGYYLIFILKKENEVSELSPEEKV